MLSRKDERRLHLDHVVLGAVRAQEDPLVPHALNGGVGHVGGGLEIPPLPHELDAREQASAPRVADGGVAITEVFEARQQPLADLRGVLL